MGSELGISDEKLLAVLEWEPSTLFDDDERLALEYADAITMTDRDVSDELFTRLQSRWDDDALVELTEIIAWENASSKFNWALRIPSQRLWRRKPAN
ncbi:MAG: carboxymuconolactone decarboxylase family protein [Egibacteraceae bacterium]